MEDLKKLIRDVPDFPKPGIIFKDITTLLLEPAAFKKVIDIMADHYNREKIDKIIAVESRGFIFGAALSYRMGIGFILARKPGKLPAATVKEMYDLEYGQDAIEVHADSISNGERILIVDDLLATGGTAQACGKLVEKLGGTVIGYAVMIELAFLAGKEKLTQAPVYSLITY
ncbi:MAG: adenine phosphoribosyltransferase [bacterium]|nr:adenine phosphoribosyltransferase [bacterium]